MSVRELEKEIQRLDNKLFFNRLIIRNYFHSTIVPIIKHIHPIGLIGSAIFITFLMRKNIKKLALFFVKPSKKLVASYVFMKARSLMR